MRLLSAVGAAVLAGVLAAPAGAATTPVSFSCTGDAVTAQVTDGSVVDPITAGGDNKACQPDVTGLPNVGEALNIEGTVTAKTAFAATDPGGTVPFKSTPGATAGVEGLNLFAGAVTVDAARSAITAACSNGTPTFTPTSNVANISLAGTPIVLDGVLQPITDGLTNALGALVEVRLNEVVDLPHGKAVRAARITLVRGGTPGGQGCPNGSVYVPASNLCVIAGPSGNTTGPGSVIVGPPGKGPIGGTVITLQEARGKYKRSPCVRGGGLHYVVVGTNGKDHITGTNRRDRILGLRGGDRLDAGKGRDCIDGGKGKDGMTGGQQADRVYGRLGRDFLNGDAGSDLLNGGRGNDYINAAYGADRVFGGKGRDKMNVATAGKAARVHGGSGRDKVRANPGDLPYIHGVEKIIITHKIKG
jgi:Ca2+-binding RTX toxin-like protein